MMSGFWSGSSSPPPPRREPPKQQGNKEHDQAVISTADDAIIAKLSCVEKRYYDDPFIHAMAQGASGLINTNKKSSPSSRNRRSAGPASSATEPIIRRGTHARVKAVERAIDAFLSLPLSSENVARQVVILGAGRDTAYLRFRFGRDSNNSTSNLDERNNVRWYEVDHPSVIQQKAQRWLPGCIPSGYSCKCDSNKDTGNSYTISIEPSKGGKGSSDSEKAKSSSNYHLVGHDLRSSPAALFETLTHHQHGYDPSAPTLFVLECVMMYLPQETTRELLSYLANSSAIHPSANPSSCINPSDSFVAVVIYDPIPSNDRFGQLMIENLRRAGIMGRGKGSSPRIRRSRDNDDDDDNHHNNEHHQSSQELLSLEKTQTLSDQLTKLTQSGFDIAVGCDMMNAYDHGVISMDDRRRAARCEMLDELEEFVLLMKHYCLVVGVSSCSKKKGVTRTKRSEEENASSLKVEEGNNECVGFQLCSVGNDSLMGFQEGRCTVGNRKK